MNGSLSIPRSLKEQFDELERRLWRFDAIVAASGAFSGLLFSYAVMFLSDRFWNTPPWLRLVFTMGGLLNCACFLFGYSRRWLWGDRSFLTLANLVQKRHQRLGDRLLGIVELADEKKRPTDFSAALCAAAINQVANEAGKVDFKQAVGVQRPRRYALCMLAGGVLATIFCIAAPKAGWNAFQRWIRPTSSVTRYTFVSLDHVPDHLVVAQGEPFEIQVGMSAYSLLHPTKITAQFEQQIPTESPVVAGCATLKIAGQTEPGVLSLRAGDVQGRIKIEPLFRPELHQLSAHIEFPAYLLYQPMDQKIDGGSLTFLKGSRITFRGEVTRALASATIASNPSASLRVDGHSFHTTPVIPLAATQWLFAWKDELGLENASPVKVRLQPEDDIPPQVECRGLPAAIGILEEEVVHVDIAANDDYGIRDIGVRWQITSKRPGGTPGHFEQQEIKAGPPQAKVLAGRFDFSPLLLHIPSDTGVLFWATATDRFPERPASVSEPHEIYVLSRESHAQLIEQQLEKLMTTLEDLTRRQETLLDAGKSVRAEPHEKLADTDSEKKLAEQGEEQHQTGEDLQKLAKRIAETVSEASRNKGIPASTLQNWSAHAQAMSALAQENMPAAEQSLTEAKENASDRASKLDRALNQEAEILKQMREMQKSTEKSIESFITQNIAMRLRKIATSEKNISRDFQTILPGTIGLRADQLSGEPKQFVEQLASSHATSRVEAGKLHGEIASLFERTMIQRYGDVSQEMDSSDSDEALQKLTENIQNNLSVGAIEASSAWSKQFDAWADRISEKDESKAGDASGKAGGGASGMKAMLALMKIRQAEDALRDQTSALEEQKNDNSNYDHEAKNLSIRQKEVQEEVEQLSADPISPLPRQDLTTVSKAMGDANKLLNKPETDDPTVAAETDAINMIDEVMLAHAKKSGKSTTSLMQMMGFGPGGITGGGSTAGGGTDRANRSIPGNRGGGLPEGRHVLQASGNGDSTVPAEFRDAIESYQNAVERQNVNP